MYPIIPQQISQSRRAEINESILFAIDTDNKAVDKEIVYNSYTGLGGLHNLKQDDYASYYEYSQAKKEIELGQFFTPHDISRKMVELIAPENTDMVLDMCCGMGNFFNHLPNLSNAYGFDIDPNAVKVAKHLYPEANIELSDIRRYNPEQRFDIIIGNPPFNLDFDGTLSQFYYINKAHEILNPTGILILIVPQSFLNSEFWEKSRVTAISRDFSFIGQTKLESNAFTLEGVTDFATKIMVFECESKYITMRPYNEDDFVGFEELKKRVDAIKRIKIGLKLQIQRETNNLNKAEEEVFEYCLHKYLYELKTHPHLRKHYKKTVALVSKFRNQKPPEHCSAEEYKKWDKNKLTHSQVLSVIQLLIKKQYEIPRKEVALVRTSYSYKLKGYAPHLLDKVERKTAPMYELIFENSRLPLYDKMTPKLHKQYALAIEDVERKRRIYFKQNLPFADMVQDEKLKDYINKLTFINKERKICWFTDLQKYDMGLMFQKNHTLLNWQQGGGKTAASYHYGKYMLKNKTVKNVVVLAPALANEITWKAFLTLNREKFVTLNSLKDVENIPEGYFAILSISMIAQLKKKLIRFMKIKSKKVCLLFDESDEITNPLALRTKTSLAIFRRAKRKLLFTGTITRNYVGELYSQLEMLYNNSVNMLCYCSDVYSQNKDKEIESDTNNYYLQPYPAKGGANLFKHCFCPSKVTVFGIEKQNQDIYNKEYLSELIDKTILTRKFKELAGEKYKIHTHIVTPCEGEKAVYRVILEEFRRICEIYFRSTGDSRKEAALRIIRQINLMIKACSVPNTMPDYLGDSYPQKTREIDKLIRTIQGKVTVGCTTLNALGMYTTYLSENFPNRPLFVIEGSIPFKKRAKIITQFELTVNGILVCTQQSLKSSVNIPSCDDVILESLQWNIAKMEQFYFRFIRLDSKNNTNVHFMIYEESIEQNLIALLLTKERLNEFIKTGEVKQQSDIFDEFDISVSFIEKQLKRERDKEGNLYISWGSQKVS